MKFAAYNKLEWTNRLEAELAQAESGPPYTAGMLEFVLGKRSSAWAHLQQTILLPDRMMSHHLSRMGMAGTGLPEYPPGTGNKPQGH